MGVVGVGAGVKVETDVGVAPGVGVGELLLPPPQAATANNNSRQGNKAALIECLVRLKFFNIAFSWRRFVPFNTLLELNLEKEEILTTSSVTYLYNGFCRSSSHIWHSGYITRQVGPRATVLPGYMYRFVALWE